MTNQTKTTKTTKYPNAKVIGECIFTEILDAKTGKLLGIRNVKHYTLDPKTGKMTRTKLN